MGSLWDLYGISIAVASHSLDHSLFTHLIVQPNLHNRLMDLYRTP